MAEYGELFGKAAAFATELHQGQRRKGTDIPYVAHLFSVAALVAEYGGSEEQGIAALLHDSIEDRPNDGETAREILNLFGSNVLAMVVGCTNDLKVGPGWSGTDSPFVAGKKLYVNHLSEVDNGILLIALCDKLHNARSTVQNLKTSGQKVWQRFKGKKEFTLFYFRALAGLASSSYQRGQGKGIPVELIENLVSTVAEMHEMSDYTMSSFQGECNRDFRSCLTFSDEQEARPQ